MTALIRVINPNSTVEMTDAIRASARAVAGPDMVIDAVTSVSGPPAVDGHVTDAMSVPGVLAAIEEGERAGAAAHVIACFGDPGLFAAREMADAPVVGIAEAGMRTAGYLARRFSVVTTVARAVPHIEELAGRYGIGGPCAGVHASGVGVLDLHSDPTAYDRIIQECRRALGHDRSEAVVLGCAGMAPFTQLLSTDLGVPVIDPVAAAATAAVGLVRMGARTSKIGEFAPLANSR